jgi:hypothetical protein
LEIVLGTILGFEEVLTKKLGDNHFHGGGFFWEKKLDLYKITGSEKLGRGIDWL